MVDLSFSGISSFLRDRPPVVCLVSLIEIFVPSSYSSLVPCLLFTLPFSFVALGMSLPSLMSNFSLCSVFLAFLVLESLVSFTHLKAVLILVIVCRTLAFVFFVLFSLALGGRFFCDWCSIVVLSQAAVASCLWSSANSFLGG